MSARVRLFPTVGYWSACAVLGMAAFHWWDGETWRQVATFPLVMAVTGVFAELRRRKREKPAAAPPPPPL